LGITIGLIPIPHMQCFMYRLTVVISAASRRRSQEIRPKP